jgi:hypothetical protein
MVCCNTGGLFCEFARGHQLFGIAGWLRSFFCVCAAWILFPFVDLDDFDKVGIDAGGAVQRSLNASCQGLYYGLDTVSNTYTFVVEVRFPDEAVTLAGAPAQTYITWTFPGDKSLKSFNVTVETFNKTATRLPEAMFFRWLLPGGAQGIALQKMDEWLDPTDVVIGGNQRLHSVSRGGVSIPAHSSSLNISSLDTRLVCVGEPTSFPTPTNTPADVSQGVASVLWNNIW